jgi:hypothetical protein
VRESPAVLTGIIGPSSAGCLECSSDRRPSAERGTKLLEAGGDVVERHGGRERGRLDHLLLLVHDLLLFSLIPDLRDQVGSRRPDVRASHAGLNRSRSRQRVEQPRCAVAGPRAGVHKCSRYRHRVDDWSAGASVLHPGGPARAVPCRGTEHVKQRSGTSARREDAAAFAVEGTPHHTTHKGRMAYPSCSISDDAEALTAERRCDDPRWQVAGRRLRSRVVRPARLDRLASRLDEAVTVWTSPCIAAPGSFGSIGPISAELRLRGPASGRRTGGSSTRSAPTFDASTLRRLDVRWWDAVSAAPSCDVRQRFGVEGVDMNSLLWTIFAVIGIIVVIGWVLGR